MKRFSYLLCLPLLLLSGCNQGQTSYIGLVSAMDEEIAFLLEKATIEKQETIGGVDFRIGKLGGKNVIISKAGVGKIRASSGITTLLNHYHVSSVLFTGVAGGVKEGSQVLDQVIASSIVEHDYGFVSNDGFVWAGGDPGKKEAGEIFYPDASFVDLAYRCATLVAGEGHVYKGCIATGDQFVASQEYVEYLQKDFDAYACEMEGAALAKVCSSFQVPYALLRVLSDKADGQAHDSYGQFTSLAAEQSGQIVLKMLESL